MLITKIEARIIILPFGTVPTDECHGMRGQMFSRSSNRAARWCRLHSCIDPSVFVGNITVINSTWIRIKKQCNMCWVIFIHTLNSIIHWLELGMKLCFQQVRSVLCVDVCKHRAVEEFIDVVGGGREYVGCCQLCFSCRLASQAW